ncbi:MAG: hypothetical protein ACRCUY_11335 [Thermoguttaceae bacterium]
MLTFQELGGSPVERYTFEGFSATRRFLLPWEKRTEFALAVFGNPKSPLQERRLIYPGRKDVFARSLHFEPFDPSAINAKEMVNLAKDFVNYNGSFAKAVVEYQTLDGNDRIDAPINDDGTSITYKLVIESECVDLPVRGWRWTNTNTVVAADQILPKMIPWTMHILTWHNVIDPPWEQIQARQGTVNNGTFIGCAPETLLFMGAEANKLYRPGHGLDDDGPSAFVWAIKYSFRERAIRIGNNVYGWNHICRLDSGDWTYPTNSGARLYDLRDFNSLFRSEPII